MKKFRDFESAREFVRKLGLKGITEWREYCKSGNKPDDIPSAPNGTYKKDFNGMGDWLGTGRKTKTYQEFSKAREFVRALGLKNKKEWDVYCKSGNKPDDIPSAPNGTYKNEGYVDLGDWLNTENTYLKGHIFRSFQESREFVRALKLNSETEWREYCKSGDKPDDIPSNPDQVYKNKGWKGHKDWLDHDRIATYNRTYLSFKEAREFVRALKLKGQKEWYEYCKSGNKPDDIPSYPWQVYKEWKKK